MIHIYLSMDLDLDVVTVETYYGWSSVSHSHWNHSVFGKTLSYV